jgi:hypothetical protein
MYKMPNRSVKTNGKSFGFKLQSFFINPAIVIPYSLAYLFPSRGGRGYEEGYHHSSYGDDGQEGKGWGVRKEGF